MNLGSKRVLLLGGHSNRRVVSVMNGRTVVVMPIPWSQKPNFAEGIYNIPEGEAPEPPKPLAMERYVQRHFRCGDFKMTWWCESSLNPQECLLTFCYPYACLELVAIRRELPNVEKHNSIPIPHGWKNYVNQRDPTVLLDQHSVEAVRIYENRHSN